MKYLTYTELMDLALEHYSDGGDATYECVDLEMFKENYSNMTKEDALAMFKRDRSIEIDRAGWFF